jgi:putative intracellular protease/amidase
MGTVIIASSNSAGQRDMAGPSGRKVTVLATDGVEQVELTEPVKALKEAWAEVVVIAPKGGEIQGMNHNGKGDKLKVGQELANASPDGFDALVLPVSSPSRIACAQSRRPLPSCGILYRRTS